MAPSLNLEKGSLGGVNIGDKLFAIGGGNGIESLSDVEMLDLYLGRWIRTRSMLQRVNDGFDMFFMFNLKLSTSMIMSYGEQIWLEFSFLDEWSG